MNIIINNYTINRFTTKRLKNIEGVNNQSGRETYKYNNTLGPSNYIYKTMIKTLSLVEHKPINLEEV